jgi:hypothetical protein
VEMFVSDSKATHSGISGGGRIATGFAISATERESSSGTTTDNADPSDTASGDSSVTCLRHLSGGTPTLDSAADFVSQDNTGFTVNWTTADATPRANLYLALGPSAWPRLYYVQQRQGAR